MCIPLENFQMHSLGVVPAAPPLGGRGLAARQGGGRPPPRIYSQINFIFICKEVPTAQQGGGRPPAAPLPGGRGIEL